MFLHLCVILFMGEGGLPTLPPDADLPRAGQTPPPDADPLGLGRPSRCRPLQGWADPP